MNFSSSISKADSNISNSVIYSKRNSIFIKKSPNISSSLHEQKKSGRSSLILIKKKTEEGDKESTVIFERHARRFSINLMNQDENFFSKDNVEENLRKLKSRVDEEVDEEMLYNLDEDRRESKDLTDDNTESKDNTHSKLQRNNISSFKILRKSLTGALTTRNSPEKLPIDKGVSKSQREKTACDSFNLTPSYINCNDELKVNDFTISKSGGENDTDGRNKEEKEKVEIGISSNINSSSSSSIPSNNPSELASRRNKPSLYPFEVCIICDDLTNTRNILYLTHCKHMLCKRCAKNFYEDQIEVGEVDLTCPIFHCKAEVDKDEVIKKLVSDAHYASWTKNLDYEREREELLRIEKQKLEKRENNLGSQEENINSMRNEHNVHLQKSPQNENRNLSQLDNLPYLGGPNNNNTNNNLNIEIEVDNKLKFNTEIAIYNKFNYENEGKDMNRKNTQKTAFKKPSILDTVKQNVKGFSKKHVLEFSNDNGSYLLFNILKENFCKKCNEPALYGKYSSKVVKCLNCFVVFCKFCFKPVTFSHFDQGNPAACKVFKRMSDRQESVFKNTNKDFTKKVSADLLIIIFSYILVVCFVYSMLSKFTNFIFYYTFCKSNRRKYKLLYYLRLILTFICKIVIFFLTVIFGILILPYFPLISIVVEKLRSS